MKFQITMSSGPATELLGERIDFSSTKPVEGLLDVLTKSPREPEAWWSPAIWSGDRRTSLAWECAYCAVTDLNFRDAIGEHVMAPEDHLARFKELAPGLPGSMWHSTPRGARIVTVFNNIEENAALWLRACEGLEIQLAAWLQANDLACDRLNGFAGYEASRPSHDSALSRFLFGPHALVGGIQRDAVLEMLRVEPVEIIDVALLAPDRPIALPAGDPEALSYEAAARRSTDVDIATGRLRSVATPVASGRRQEPPPPSDADAPPPEDDSGPASGGPASLPDNVRPIRPQMPEEDRPEIKITTEEEDVNDQAVKSLCRDLRVFQRAKKLVTPLRSAAPINGVERNETSLTITEIPLPKLREMLSSSARWKKVDAAVAKRAAAMGTANETVAKKEPIKWSPSHPPVWAVQAVQARGVWQGIRPLMGVTEWPRMRPDGTLLFDPGYDAKTGLYYEPMGEVDPVPQEPTDDQIVKAVADLRHAVCDFPFANEFGFSAWLAGLLTPLAISSFDGPTPVFLSESPTRGSGKSKLWMLVGRILTGRDLAGTPYSEDPEEIAKKITSSALAGDTTIFFDNVAGNFGGGPLDQATTARAWKSRVLGKSENTPELPLDCAWYVSGNNLVFHGDIDRRVCICRIEPLDDHPEERTDFVHRELLPWASGERHRLLSAALTLLRAFAVAGQPQGEARYWGSFEGWSKVVKACIEWLGLPFQAAPTSGALVTSEVEELGVLIAAWEWADPKGEGITASGMIRIVDEEQRNTDATHRTLDAAAVGFIDTIGAGVLPNAKSLGCRLRKWRGKICSGRSIREAGSERSGTIRWAVRKPVQSTINLHCTTPETPPSDPPT